eukprot:964424-Pyramimonas_sp.AAC.1
MRSADREVPWPDPPGTKRVTQELCVWSDFRDIGFARAGTFVGVVVVIVLVVLAVLVVVVVGVAVVVVVVVAIEVVV